MSEDEKGATEDEIQKIKVIRGKEVLGYEGAGARSTAARTRRRSRRI